MKLTPEQRAFYFEYYVRNGMTEDQAETAVDLWEICSLDSPRRLFNDLKKNKDREMQESMRKQFSPNPVTKATKAYFDQYILDV